MCQRSERDVTCQRSEIVILCVMLSMKRSRSTVVEF